MEDDITEFFIKVIRQAGSVDIAESDFKRCIDEDDELRKRYRLWCQEVGSSERNGFLDFCQEYLDSQASIWDSLENDFDN